MYDPFNLHYRTAFLFYLNAANVKYVIAALLSMWQLRVEHRFEAASVHVLCDDNVHKGFVDIVQSVFGPGITMIYSGRTLLRRVRRFELLQNVNLNTFCVAVFLDIHDIFDVALMMAELHEFREDPQCVVLTRTHGRGAARRCDAGQIAFKLSRVRNLVLQISASVENNDYGVEFGSDERYISELISNHFDVSCVFHSTGQWGASRVDQHSVEELVHECKSKIGSTEINYLLTTL